MTNTGHNENTHPNGKLLGSVTLDNLAATGEVPATVRGPNVKFEIHPDGDGFRVNFYRRKDSDRQPTRLSPASSVEYAPPEVAVAAVQEALNRVYM